MKPLTHTLCLSMVLVSFIYLGSALKCWKIHHPEEAPEGSAPEHPSTNETVCAEGIDYCIWGDLGGVKGAGCGEGLIASENFTLGCHKDHYKVENNGTYCVCDSDLCNEGNGSSETSRAHFPLMAAFALALALYVA